MDDKRPPLIRLATLVAEPAAARSGRILWRIREELDRNPDPGPWIAAARALAAEGTISDDAVFYFVEIFLECVTAHAAVNDPEMVRLGEEMIGIERAHGLDEDEAWLVSEAPAEWHALNAAWDRRDYEIRVAMLRALGHDDIANVLEQDPREFELREAAGHQDLWGEIDDES